MSETSPSAPQAPIPEELQKQLAEFQKRLWRVKVTEAVLAGIFGLIISFLVVFLLERIFPIPPLARFSILIAGTSLSAVFAPLMVRRWVFGHRREDQLAKLISKKFPKLGDRLLGIVELQDQTESRETLSPELRAAAMEHVARQAAKRDMTEALPNSRHRKLAIGVIVAVFLAVIGFVVAPKAGTNALVRWALPFSETEHYTFTQFDTSEIPNPLVVAKGETFAFIAPLKKDSDQKPAKARASFNGQEWLESDLTEDGSYKFDFPGQQDTGFISLEAGDASIRIKVQPELRPELTNLKAMVDLPEYLQLEPQQIDIRTGVLTALEGSKITLLGDFSRELSTAQATLIPEEKTIDPAAEPDAIVPGGNLKELIEEDEVIAPSVPKSKPLKLSLKGSTLSTEPFSITDHPASIPLTWTDSYGLAGSATFNLKIQPSEDSAPVSYMQGIERQVVILAEEVLEFEVLCEDDFGLKEIGLAWKGEFTAPSSEKPAEGSMTLIAGGPSTARLSELAIFSPATYKITPQKLMLSAYAEDYKPGRGRIYSEPIVVYILTRDEHAQLLKNKFDRIIGELEDATRREMNNLDANERLDQQKTPEELQEEDAQRKLTKSQDAEQQNAEKMEDIAKKMEKLFKDASRNGDLDTDTMKKMAEALDSMKELAKEDLPEIEKKLGEAQNQKSTPEKTEKDLKKAIEKQKEALKKMQETVKKANEANQNFEASTFINRLKRAASEQDGIASAFGSAMRGEDKKAESKITGATPDKLDPIHGRLIGELDLQQKRTTGDIRWIQEDLGHFHARTQKDIHKELIDDMKDYNIDTMLETLRQEIGKNQSFTSAVRSKQLAEKLREWAKKLEGDKDGGGGGGEGDGGGSQEEKDFEFMLKVMRMVQTEQDIRSRTRSLEQMLRSLNLRKQPN